MIEADRDKLKRTFDHDAELYDQARPDYPDQIFDDLFALGALEQVFWWSDAYGRARPLAAVSMAASLLCLLARRRFPLASCITAFALAGITFWLSPANPPVVFAALLLVFCVSGIANPPALYLLPSPWN